MIKKHSGDGYGGISAPEGMFHPERTSLMMRYLAIADRAEHDDYGNGQMDTAGIRKSRLTSGDIGFFRGIVGEQNISQDDPSRLRHQCIQKHHARRKKASLDESVIPDSILFPRNEREILRIMGYCTLHGISIRISGVPMNHFSQQDQPRRLIVLELSRHLNRIISVNEENLTVAVEPGISPESLDHFLRGFGSGYTCVRPGRLRPDGEGILSIRSVYPAGLYESSHSPWASPAMDSLFTDYNGILGVITRMTLTIQPHTPDSTEYCSFLFRDFPSAHSAMRNVVQAGFGTPDLFRICDSPETERLLEKQGFHGSLKDRIMKHSGYLTGERCILLSAVGGDENHAKFITRKVKDIAASASCRNTGRDPVKTWMAMPNGPRLRDIPVNEDILAGSLDAFSAWDRVILIWSSLRQLFHTRYNSFCSFGIDQARRDGALLRIFFLVKRTGNNETDDYRNFIQEINRRIAGNGGRLSGHPEKIPYLPTNPSVTGEHARALLKTIKKHVDPRGILAPI